MSIHILTVCARILRMFYTMFVHKTRRVNICGMISYCRFKDENKDKTKCEYNENKAYVVFSAMGSFFVPLTVMLYVYARISCVIAQRHENLEAMNNGTSQVKWPLNAPVSSIYTIVQCNTKGMSVRTVKPFYIILRLICCCLGIRHKIRNRKVYKWRL